MIYITRETCFRLTEAPKYLPCRNGRNISTSTIFRWAQRGVNGCRLEVIRIGGAMFTSSEALQRFSERLTQRHMNEDDLHKSPPQNHTSTSVEAELDQLGF